jgi:hypothetical protein
VTENLWDDIIDIVQNAQSGITVDFATVHSVNSGGPTLIFSGEAAPSAKDYKFLKSYIPVAGDRVMLLRGIIIGGWR